jgi:hypothetical protein
MKKPSKRDLTLILTTLLLVIAMAGGTWSTTFGAALSQGTLPTVTPIPPTSRPVSPSDTPNPSATARVPSGGTGVIPLIFITTTSCDQTVSIRTANFPANTDFDVLMNYYGTLGIGGQKVDTVNSGGGGVMTWTFNIPDFLKGQQRIAIRLQSGSGYYSYNWFWNTCPCQPAPSIVWTRGLIPIFKIAAVVHDQSVTIKTANFPANDTFDALINRMGTLGIGGVKVDKVKSSSGGQLTFTFSIPDSLKGQSRIALRLQSPSSGYFSYGWFDNATATFNVSFTAADTSPVGLYDGPSDHSYPPRDPCALSNGSGPAVTPTASSSSSSSSGWTGIPTFSIKSVVHDGTVTITTHNFPAGETFKVTMNKFGTLGVGGVQVDSVSSGSGGTLSFTFNVPDSLKGQKRIAIRLQSTSSGRYAFNWFWNSTYP